MCGAHWRIGGLVHSAHRLVQPDGMCYRFPVGVTVPQFSEWA